MKREISKLKKERDYPKRKKIKSKLEEKTKHGPPYLCLEAALLTGVTMRLSMPDRGL